MTMYLATTNSGKLRDFSLSGEQLGPEPQRTIQFAVLPGLSEIPTPVEDQDSFAGNARLKAEFYSRHAPGVLVLCDDSGLEVDALGGRPGVRSARFAADLGMERGADGWDASNNEALLLEMLEQTERTGRYRCVLALARDGQVLKTASGSIEGMILTEPDGLGGFGYDPLFFVPELGCTMAQASPLERQCVSHRSRALRALLRELPADL